MKKDNKKFFKITKQKIVISLFLVLLPFLLFSISLIFIGGNSKFSNLLSLFIVWFSILIYFIPLSAINLLSHQEFNALINLIFVFFSFVFTIFYIYTLACLISWIFKKFRKSSSL